MTEAELLAAWERYMHRADLTADLALVLVLAGERIKQRLLIDWDTTDPTPEDYGRLFLHAGLSQLHQLAQDDEGRAREERAFEDAAQDWTLQNSIAAGDACATHPYTGA